MENSNFSTWITSLYVSQPTSVVFAFKTAHFGPEFQVSMGPSPHLRFLHAKQRVLAQNYKSLWVPDLTCPFVQSKRPDLHQNIKSILVPALFSGFCMQNSVIIIRITCLYGSQHLSVVFGCKTATFWAELQVSMGPRHDLSFCGCKTACLASEKLVSMGPSPHVRILDAKQRLLDQNNKSLTVPDKTCRFVHGKQQL